MNKFFKFIMLGTITALSVSLTIDVLNITIVVNVIC